MKNLFSKLLITAVVLFGPLSISPCSQAQSTNKVAKDGSMQKLAHPFRGKLAAVDKVAKTITVGKSVYHITSETKIKKGDKPAILEDGVIGEPVSGYAKPMEGGKMLASSVNFGPKWENAGTKKSPKK